MRTIHRSHFSVLVITTVLAMTFVVPLAANAEEQILVMAPAGSSWEETSGYRAVEANRAAASALLVPEAGPSWDETSGYGAVEASRALASEAARDAEDEESVDDALAAKRAQLFARFRAFELSLSRHIGAQQPGTTACGGGR
jgi:hypothetical protein